jgi:hypothetical protein
MTTREKIQAALDWHEYSVGDPSCLDKEDWKCYETIRTVLQAVLKGRMFEEEKNEMREKAIPARIKKRKVALDMGAFP